MDAQVAQLGEQLHALANHPLLWLVAAALVYRFRVRLGLTKAAQDVQATIAAVAAPPAPVVQSSANYIPPADHVGQVRSIKTEIEALEKQIAVKRQLLQAIANEAGAAPVAAGPAVS